MNLPALLNLSCRDRSEQKDDTVHIIVIVCCGDCFRKQVLPDAGERVGSRDTEGDVVGMLVESL